MDMTYTVGVQVWPLPIFRKFRVIDHKVQGDKVALMDPDGGCVVVPGLDRKALRIYPDHRRTWEKRERLEAQAQAEAEAQQRLEAEVQQRVEARLAQIEAAMPALPMQQPVPFQGFQMPLEQVPIPHP